jgi:Uma2 family endonuclease
MQKKPDRPRMTGDELSRIGNMGRCELIQGELHTMPPTGHIHGYVENRIGSILREYVEQRGLGRVLTGEVGIYTGRNPDTVRGADVVFISNERLDQMEADGYLTVAPELVVEVVSPNDRWIEIVDKLEEYFAIGVAEVWIADPRKQEIRIYYGLDETVRCIAPGQFASSRVLPEFQMAVSSLFGSEGEER